MFLRFALVFVLFASHLAMACSQDIVSSKSNASLSKRVPVVAPLPGDVIIKHWQNRVSGTKTLYAEFTLMRNDETFYTTQHGKGKLFIKDKKQCRLDFILNKDKQQNLKTGRLKTNHPEQYSISIWDNKGYFNSINPLNKTYDQMELPTKPGSWFDLNANHFPWHKALYPDVSSKSPRKIKVRTTAKYYYLTLLPTSKEDGKYWSRIVIALDIKNKKLTGIQMVMFDSRTNTKWLFTKMEINQHTQDDKGLLDYSLKGYRKSGEVNKTAKEIKKLKKKDRRMSMMLRLLIYLGKAVSK